MEEVPERASGIRDGRDDLLIRVKNYRVSKENLEYKLSEQIIASKVITAMVYYLEKKFRSIQNKKRLLKNANKKLMRTYDEKEIVLGRGVGRLVDRISTRFVRPDMCISWAIMKWCLRGVLELDYFSQHLR